MQVFEHERQGRCRVGHGVGAVQDYKTVVVIVVVGDSMAYLVPMVHIHVGRVDRLSELNVVDFIIKHFHFRHIFYQMV